MENTATAPSAPTGRAPAVSTQPFTAGKYRVQLATESWQVEAAQALRYRTLFAAGGGRPSAEMKRTGRDSDALDAVAWHVIVLDRSAAGSERVVGTLRLTSSEALRQGLGFYTEKTFNINNIRDKYDKILELSRFCIDADGRGGSILLMIWRFTMQLILDNGFQIMVGCASFPGTDYAVHRPILSYLYRNNLAPPDLQPVPVVDNCLAIEPIQVSDPHWDEAKLSIPPLLRGYLKVGAHISDHAIIDPEFNTVFVAIYVDTNDMVTGNQTLVGRIRKS